ncbi:hypothetical protein [Streptococcus salivarius]|uniref:hypothetical protein n=1 Tax=Streptococcus salivarius TaxID=1304 RepID=UPI0011DCB69B|nr:hypothetical protein [Streptococcus salivarius]
MKERFFFFTRILARVQNSSLDLEGCYFVFLVYFQFPRYKDRQKHKAKIGKLTKKLQFLGDFIFFAKCLGFVQLNTRKWNCSMMGQFFFFTRILVRVQNSSLDSEGSFAVFI